MKGFSWIYLLVRRWFLTGRNRRIPALTALPTAGLAVGVAALIVVLGVMNGFQGGYIDSILEVSSFHIRIDTTPGVDESFAARIRDLPGVRSVLPFNEIRCLGSSATRSATVISVRSLPHDAFMLDPGMAASLGLAGRELPERGGVILGSELARKLDVSIGDTVTLVTVVSDPDEGASTKTATVRVSQLFRSGYYEFDSGLALADFTTTAALFASSSPGLQVLGIKLDDRYNDARVSVAISRSTGLDLSEIESWRSYNRAFFGALRTEKIVMMILVGLIFLVVGVNIHHAMRRNVAEKTIEIAVIRAMGGRASDIASVFLLDGIAVGLAGACLGLIAGLVIVYNINGIFRVVEMLVGTAMNLVSMIGGGRSGDYLIFSPRYFYLMEVPVRVSFAETTFIALAAIASSAFAAGSAASRLSRLNPAQVLRYE